MGSTTSMSINPWLQILLTGTLAAIVTQSLAWTKEWFIARTNEKRQRFSVSLLLIVALEEYTLACVKHIGALESAIRDCTEQMSYEPLNRVRRPTLQIPDTIDWRWIPSDIALATTSLKFRVQFAHEVSNECGEIEWLQGSEKELKEYRKIGKFVWQLACRLRESQSLPKFDGIHDEWNFLSHLDDGGHRPARGKDSDVT